MKAFYAIARKPAAMEPQTNRPHTYEESTMSFRETRHFDINFRETRSISTTFSVPFLHHAILLFPLAHSFLLLSGSRSVIAGHKVARIVGKMSHHHHAFSFSLSQDSPPPLYTHFFPPPPQRTYPKLPGIDGPHEYPPLSLFFSLPSFYLSPFHRREKNARRPTVCIFFPRIVEKLKWMGGEEKKKREKKKWRENIHSIEHVRVSTFLEKRKEKNGVWNDFDEFENHLSSKSISNITDGTR